MSGNPYLGFFVFIFYLVLILTFDKVLVLVIVIKVTLTDILQSCQVAPCYCMVTAVQTDRLSYYC